MGAFLLRPKAFTVVSASQATTAPATNLGFDHPGRVWQSSSGTSIVLDIQGDGSTIDTLALVGSDLATNETIKLQFATTQANLTAATPTAAVAGYAGNKDADVTTKTVVRFTAQAFNFVRITITLPTARVMQAQRLVIGSAVTSDGIDYDAEQSFEDASQEIAGFGYSGWEVYPTVAAWKFTMSGVKDADWDTKWFPLLRAIGKNGAVFFCPNDTLMSQHQMIFGRVNSTATGKASAFNWWVASVAITALAP